MNEIEKYIHYIAAHRAHNQNEIDRLLSEGFRPSTLRLQQLVTQDSTIRHALFNKDIEIFIDCGHRAGHIYGKFPCYNKRLNCIVVSLFGFYPDPALLSNGVLGPGIVHDETNESRRIQENLPSHGVRLPITEEAWIRLSHWLSKKRDDPNIYALLGNNCATFIHEAVMQAGYSDGLIDKFDPSEIRNLNFRPIKAEILQYFRFDKKNQYLALFPGNPGRLGPNLATPVSADVLVSVPRSVPESVPASVPIPDPIPSFERSFFPDLYLEAKKERARANRASYAEIVHLFFDTHHTVQFYERFYQNRSLKLNDLVWLLDQHAPNIHMKLYSILEQVYSKVPEDVKAQHGHKPTQFIAKLCQTLVQAPDSITPDIQQLIETTQAIEPLDLQDRRRKEKRVRYYIKLSTVHTRRSSLLLEPTPEPELDLELHTCQSVRPQSQFQVAQPQQGQQPQPQPQPIEAEIKVQADNVNPVDANAAINIESRRHRVYSRQVMSEHIRQPLPTIDATVLSADVTAAEQDLSFHRFAQQVESRLNDARLAVGRAGSAGLARPTVGADPTIPISLPPQRLKPYASFQRQESKIGLTASPLSAHSKPLLHWLFDGANQGNAGNPKNKPEITDEKMLKIVIHWNEKCGSENRKNTMP